ncbi:MAG: hypothetical protein HOP19_21285 [Acidobacteria bacterium]|nr:hypothetical protein [Acidobacteriota bacterium]
MRYQVFFSLLLCGLATTALAQIPPITSGYGANGSFTYTEARFANPLDAGMEVVVFRPNTNAPVPVIFYAPGYSAQTPDLYGPLFPHLASRGYAVVYSPFQVSLDFYAWQRRYETMWAGFDEAVKRYGTSFDLTRVGFAGHSYGGGATFAMLQRGAVGKGWGRNGLFMFVMAPWYVYEITARQMLEFPQHAQVLIQVYEEDVVNDHRIAKEAFERLNLPASEKDFMLLRSDSFEGQTLEAHHNVPSGVTANGLDYYGVWRPLDALADYAFTNNQAAKAIALGNGNTSQRFMGEWPAVNGKPGRAVKESLAGDCVTLTRTAFLFNYDQTINALSNASAASYQTRVTPSSIVAAFGKELAAQTAFNTTSELPTSLNNVTVRVRDSACVERLAPLFFVSPAQINFLVPPETALGEASVFASTSLPAANVPASQNGAAFSLGTLNVVNVAPGIFTANGNGQGVAAALILRFKPNGEMSYEAVSRYDEATRRFVSLPINLSDPREQAFLVLFGSGWRNRNSLNEVVVTAGGAPLEVLYAGAQGLNGLDQINLKLPATLAGRGEVNLVVTVGGVTSNTATLRF